MRPSDAQIIRPNEGVGNAGCPLHPQPRVQCVGSTRVYPNARLLRLSKYGIEPVTVEQTDHYKVMREFCDDPAGFVEAAIEE
jgi:hypothetical protein